MLLSHGEPPSQGFERYVERLIIDSPDEVTSDGFVYGVADPEAIGYSSGVLGHVEYRGDKIECGLVIGEDIPFNTRRKIASITIASITSFDRYSLARALSQHTEETDDPSEMTDLTVHVGENLRAHQEGIARLDTQNRFYEVHPLTRQTLKSALGWLHLYRPLTEAGLENIQKLEQGDIYVPDLDSGLRLSTRMVSRAGTQPVGLVYAREKSEKHTCPCCAGQILKGSARLTLILDQPKVKAFDHHHYHKACFADKILDKLDHTAARIEPNPLFTTPKRKPRFK